MRYNIPQFIDTEDRIIGPLTLKQFFWLLGGGGIAFVIWQFSGNITVFVAFTAPVAITVVLLAFWKINGKPLVKVLINFIKFIKNPKKYLWKK